MNWHKLSSGELLKRNHIVTCFKKILVHDDSCVVNIHKSRLHNSQTCHTKDKIGNNV